MASISLSLERKHRMLKEFLSEESNSHSSNSFKSFSGRESTVRDLLQFDLNLKPKIASKSKLLRSRSRAASSTISAVHKASEIVINVVKHLPFATVKSPSGLPRSISRRLLRREFWNNKCKNDDVGEISVTVKVKDILRWRSFRDLIEEKPPPPLDFDFSSSPSRCTGSSSSWCECESENNLKANYLPWRCQNSDEDQDVAEGEVEMGKKYLHEHDYGVGGDCTTKEIPRDIADPKGELDFDEKEQHSPVSVHDFPFQEEDEVVLPSFHQSLANMEMKNSMFMKKIQEFEGTAELEPVNLEKRFFMEENTWSEEEVQEEKETEGSREKAKQLLNHVKETSAAETSDTNVDCLLLDFFRHELTNRNHKDNEFNSEMVRVAKAWMVGKYDGLFDWEVDDKRNAYITHMEEGLRWSKFEEEQEELVLEMEIGVLSNLVDELLVDLVAITGKLDTKIFLR